MTEHLFPFLDYWWSYVAFNGLVAVFLALDLVLFHRKAHVVGFREASAWTAVWAALTLLFCLGLYSCAVWEFGATTGEQIEVEFLTGHIVEWSLSGSIASRMRMEKRVQIYLASPIAQRLHSPRSYRHYHGRSDNGQAMGMLYKTVRSNEQVEAYLKFLKLSVKEMLRANWPMVVTLAEELLNRLAMKGSARWKDL